MALCAVIVSATTSTNDPKACVGWLNCPRAFTDDGNYSSTKANMTHNRTGTWYNHGINISNSSNITNVTVGVDFKASNVNGYLSVQVSWDGGRTYGSAQSVGSTTIATQYAIDVTSDTAWTGEKLSSANLKVRGTCYSSSGSVVTCSMDWIPVQVTYT